MNLSAFKNTLEATKIVIGNPLPQDKLILRVEANGSVYPSKALVAMFDLEYGNKGSNTGNGVDIFRSKDLLEFNVVNMNAEMPRALIFAVAPKISPSLDLFKTTGYNADGTPKASVLDQGAKTFGAKLIRAAIATYKNLIPTLKEDVQKAGFLDLEIIQNVVYEGEIKLPKIEITSDNKLGMSEKAFARKHASLFFMVPFDGSYVPSEEPVAEVKEEVKKETFETTDEDFDEAVTSAPEVEAKDEFEVSKNQEVHEAKEEDFDDGFGPTLNDITNEDLSKGKVEATGITLSDNEEPPKSIAPAPVANIEATKTSEKDEFFDDDDEEFDDFDENDEF